MNSKDQPVVYYRVCVSRSPNGATFIAGRNKPFQRSAFVRGWREKTPDDAVERWDHCKPDDLIIKVTLPYDIPDSELPDMDNRACEVWTGQRVRDFKWGDY